MDQSFIMLQEQYRFLYLTLAESEHSGSTAVALIDIGTFASNPQLNEILISQFSVRKTIYLYNYQFLVQFLHLLSFIICAQELTRRRNLILPEDTTFARHTDYIDAVFVPVGKTADQKTDI